MPNLRKMDSWVNATNKCNTQVVEPGVGELKTGECSDRWCVTFLYKVHHLLRRNSSSQSVSDASMSGVMPGCQSTMMIKLNEFEAGSASLAKIESFNYIKPFLKQRKYWCNSLANDDLTIGEYHETCIDVQFAVSEPHCTAL